MELWEIRNTVAAKAAELHGQAEEKLRLDRLVAEEFKQSITRLRPIDHNVILETNIEEVMNFRNKEKQAWLNMVTALRKR